MGWTVSHLPEVTTALLKAGVGSPARSRMDLFNSANSALALDIVFVTMIEMYSFPQRPYPETRKEYEKAFAKKTASIHDIEAERVRRNMAALAKYRKR